MSCTSVHTRVLTCVFCRRLRWQLHAVPNHPRRLQLPRAGRGEPHPRPDLLRPLRLLRLLRAAQHVLGHHQRHLLRGEGRHRQPKERVRNGRLLQTGA